MIYETMIKSFIVLDLMLRCARGVYLEQPQQYAVTMPLIIVQARSSANVYRKGFDVFVSYSLQVPISFTEPHDISLVRFSGVEEACFVYADFALPQHVNGQLAPLIGISNTLSSIWVPISTPYIPSLGYIRISRVDGKEITSINELSIIFDVQPATVANGKRTHIV